MFNGVVAIIIQQGQENKMECRDVMRADRFRLQIIVVPSNEEGECGERLVLMTRAVKHYYFKPHMHARKLSVSTKRKYCTRTSTVFLACSTRTRLWVSSSWTIGNFWKFWNYSTETRVCTCARSLKMERVCNLSGGNGGEVGKLDFFDHDDWSLWKSRSLVRLSVV